MAEDRSKEAAWSAVRRIWAEEIAALNPNPGLAHISETQLASIFETFWASQFEEDRRAVRQNMEQLADLIMAVGVDDEA